MQHRDTPQWKLEDNIDYHQHFMNDKFRRCPHCNMLCFKAEGGCDFVVCGETDEYDLIYAKVSKLVDGKIVEVDTGELKYGCKQYFNWHNASPAPECNPKHDKELERVVKHRRMTRRIKATKIYRGVARMFGCMSDCACVTCYLFLCCCCGL